jgi:hypothetical protein
MNGARGITIAVVTSLIVGFSLGLVAGIVFMRFGPAPPPRWAFQERLPRPGAGPLRLGAGAHQRLLVRLEHELDLSDEQRGRVHEAVERAGRRHFETRDSLHAWIEAVLTGDQRARWRELEDTYRRSWRGRAGRPFRDGGRSPGANPEQGERR